MIIKDSDTFICPHRPSDPNSVFNLPESDHWDKRGDDMVCSYCGSMHPEQFLKLLPTIKKDSDDVWIELNDGRYKIYIERKGIKNAGDRAIKVYLNHIMQWCKEQGMGEDEINELDRQIHTAIITSNEIFLNIVAPRFKKDMNNDS
jgi:hypothetical protein